MNGGKQGQGQGQGLRDPCFNGAPVYERGKAAKHDVGVSIIGASTEPPFMNGGKLDAATAWLYDTLLQRSPRL